MMLRASSSGSRVYSSRSKRSPPALAIALTKYAQQSETVQLPATFKLCCNRGTAPRPAHKRPQQPSPAMYLCPVTLSTSSSCSHAGLVCSQSRSIFFKRTGTSAVASRSHS